MKGRDDTASLAATVAEVAAAFEMAESTIYERVRRGDIPNVGVGRSVRIPRVWLEAQFAKVGVSLRETVETVREGQFS